MAVPLGTAVGLLIAGVLAKLGWDKFHQTKAENAMKPLPGGTPQAQVTVLQPSRAYVADMLVDSASFTSPDPQNSAQPIADGLGGVGMSFMGMPPQPRDPSQTQLFQQKQPSRWMYIFRWTGAAGAPGALPGFVKQVNFYDVPAQV
jgi:hypothetical protein